MKNETSMKVLDVKKQNQKTSMFCLIAIVMFLITSCKESDVSVTGIVFDETELLLEPPNLNRFVKATVIPSNATNKLVLYESDNANVAFIEYPTIGNITGRGMGSATITATTMDGGFKTSFKIRILGNSLKNPSFEDPDDGSVVLKDWEKVPQEWFYSYYPGNSGEPVNHGNVDRQNGQTWVNADFFREKNAVDGKYVCRVAGNTTGGIYQIVQVNAGRTYKIKATVGFRRNSDAMSVKNNETVKILSADGSKLYYEAPINVNTAINPPQGTIAEVTGEFVVPAGVTEIRFQVDQRTFASPNQSPLMLMDRFSLTEQ